MLLQVACIEMNRSAGNISDSCRIEASLLHWSPSENAAVVSQLTAAGGRFDVLLAADCLFFRDFHQQLLQTLQLLMHESSVALLLQPQRGGTLDEFLSLCRRADSAVEATLCEDFNSEVRATMLLYY